MRGPLALPLCDEVLQLLLRRRRAMIAARDALAHASRAGLGHSVEVARCVRERTFAHRAQALSHTLDEYLVLRRHLLLDFRPRARHARPRVGPVVAAGLAPRGAELPCDKLQLQLLRPLEVGPGFEQLRREERRLAPAVFEGRPDRVLHVGQRRAHARAVSSSRGTTSPRASKSNLLGGTRPNWRRILTCQLGRAPCSPCGIATRTGA